MRRGASEFTDSIHTKPRMYMRGSGPRPRCNRQAFTALDQRALKPTPNQRRTLMFYGSKWKLATPAIVAMCLIGGTAFGAEGDKAERRERKEHKDLSGPNATPPTTQPGDRGF